MDSQHQDGWLPQAQTPDEWFDAVRANPQWTDRQRAVCLDQLVMKFAPDELIETARKRFSQLDGPDGELTLRIAESLATEDLLADLARALMTQPDLPPERVWDALTLFQGSSVLEQFPELADLCDELEAIAEDSSNIVEELAEQIESEPEGPWLALRALDYVEPDVRAQIIAELASRPRGEGVIEFLRLLTFVEEPLTRAAAVAALESLPLDHETAPTWRRLLREHPDESVFETARSKLDLLGESAESVQDQPITPAPEPKPLGPVTVATIPEFEPLGILMTSLDNEGRGFIVATSHVKGRRSTAAFECDVKHGVVGIIGETDPVVAERFFSGFLTQTELDVVQDAEFHGVARDLLSGSMALSGLKTPADWRFWTERTLGRDFRPGLFLRELDPALLGDQRHLRPSVKQAQIVLDSCPLWVDDSDLAFKLAEEIAIREKHQSAPNPHRDAPVYRYFFERRLRQRLDLLKQMLVWMTWFWQCSGDQEPARAALGIARQFSDPQHAVPQHPFLTAFTTRSFAHAQARLAAGADFRNPIVRDQIRARRWKPTVST